MSETTTSRFQLLGTAVLFSTGGAAIKATRFTSWQVAGFRSAVATAAILLFVPAARRNWNWRVALVALAYASTLILYVAANKLTTAANATFLQYTAPLYLLLLGPWLLREPIRKSDLALILVLAAGTALFFIGHQSPQQTAPAPFRGNVIGAFSGLSWALTIAGLRWIQRRSTGGESGMATVAAGNLVAGLISIPSGLPVVGATWNDWIIVAYLGIFQIGLAYILLTRAVRSVPALEASLLLLAEPVLNPVWAGFVHGEWPGLLTLAGGAIILAASLARSYFGERS